MWRSFLKSNQKQRSLDESLERIDWISANIRGANYLASSSEEAIGISEILGKPQRLFTLVQTENLEPNDDE